MKSNLCTKMGAGLYLWDEGGKDWVLKRFSKTHDMTDTGLQEQQCISNLFEVS